MYKIDLHYKKTLIEDENYFSDFINNLKKIYGDNFIEAEESSLDFQINFNDKIIFTIDDYFDSDRKISNVVLDKAFKTIENSILRIKSKDISKVDDIGIDEYWISLK